MEAEGLASKKLSTIRYPSHAAARPGESLPKARVKGAGPVNWLMMRGLVSKSTFFSER